jgi:hypothetical protein
MPIRQVSNEMTRPKTNDREQIIHEQPFESAATPEMKGIA